MCVAVPGKVVAVAEGEGTPMATVVLDGSQREINCAFLPDVAVGDAVLTHSGFAVRRISEAEAAETDRLVREQHPPAEAV